MTRYDEASVLQLLEQSYPEYLGLNRDKGDIYAHNCHLAIE
jgi:hypothetical protein